MNFNINEMEFYPIPNIAQISSYDTKLLQGDKSDNSYNAEIEIKVIYFDRDFVEQISEFKLPLELNLGDKELITLDVQSINIQVIDNQGLNIEYDLNIEVSDVEEVINFTEDTSIKELNEVIDIEETKEQITTSYEELVEATGIREELPVTYIEKDELNFFNLKDDYSEVKVLFNVDIDNLDKIAFKYNIAIDSCYSKITKDKTRIII